MATKGTGVLSQLREMLDHWTMAEVTCRVCRARNRVKPQQAEQARCGKCGIPLRLKRDEATGEIRS